MEFDGLGFVVLGELLAPDEVRALLFDLDKLTIEPLRGGIRRIERLLPQVAAIANSSRLRAIAKRHLTGPPQLVRAIYFDKSPSHNWFVTWHQDKTVAVSKRFEAEAWGPWSMKAEAWHVQPPLTVLENMLTIRLHLDPATVANGCLKVIPGSHRIGLLASDKVQDQVNGHPVVYCEVPAGGAVIMRPHLLHASEKAVAALPRRVLHFEYSSYPLPEGVAWSA